MDGVKIKTYAPPPIHEKEVLRYAGCGKEADERTMEILRACIRESEGQFSYRVCYVVLPTQTLLQSFPQTQRDCLLTRVTDAEKVVLFCASVGLGIDRLVNGYCKASRR